jgi:hypothetical protein
MKFLWLLVDPGFGRVAMRRDRALRAVARGFDGIGFAAPVSGPAVFCKELCP